MSRVPLRDGDDALEVNWCQLTNTRADGTATYKNAFASNHAITRDNVADIVRAGRARWKVENENNNTLKTNGYRLSHNFGHGQQHLSMLLATLHLLAFLFHAVLRNRPHTAVNRFCCRLLTYLISGTLDPRIK